MASKLVVLHHPKLKRQIKVPRSTAKVLTEKSRGWEEGDLASDQSRTPAPKPPAADKEV